MSLSLQSGSMQSMPYDLVLVGGGLANGLIALRLKALRPELRVLLIERGSHPGGNATWSFHPTDLTAAEHAWVAPLVGCRWEGHEVRFPQRRRRLRGGYASILSEDFAAHLQQVLGDALWCGVEVQSVSPDSVLLRDGRQLQARAVIDGRGACPSPHLTLGRQAFLGQLLRTRTPHGLAHPILMDATVAQGEGYRFVYVLPFAADVLLVEDTHYVDRAAPEASQLRANIAAYVADQGWHVAAVLREECGVLPITLAGDIQQFVGAAPGQPRVGLRAGLFHPTTGYSLPDAVRVAGMIAALPNLDAHTLSMMLQRHAQALWRRQRFYRLLNRMLFLAGPPSRRWQVMQRFYGLPEPLIERFYAGTSTLRDKLRILSGKPPVPLIGACRALCASHASLQRNPQ